MSNLKQASTSSQDVGVSDIYFILPNSKEGVLVVIQKLGGRWVDYEIILSAPGRPRSSTMDILTAEFELSVIRILPLNGTCQ